MLESDDKSQHNLITQKVLPKFFVALLIATFGMAIGAFFIPANIAIFMPFVVITLLLIAFFAKGNRKRKNRYDYASSRFRVSMAFVYILSFLLGMGTYPSIVHYLSTVGANAVFLSLITTAVFFGGLVFYAYRTKKDFSKWGVVLLFALLVLILLSIVGIFIQLPLFHILLAIAGVAIFSGYVLFDISCMKRHDFTEEDVPLAVLDLVLDFINLFLDIIQLFFDVPQWFSFLSKNN